MQLDPGAASFSGTNDGSAKRAERIGPNAIGVYADAGGNGTSRTSTATLTWTVSAEDLAFHGPDATISVLVEPAVSLLLDSDAADGNAAGFDMSIRGQTGGDEVGTGASTPYSIGSDDRFVLENTSERLGFGASLVVDGDLTIVWTVTCRAHGADSFFLPFSISTCDALDDSHGVSLASARITVRAPDA